MFQVLTNSEYWCGFAAEMPIVSAVPDEKGLQRGGMAKSPLFQAGVCKSSAVRYTVSATVTVEALLNGTMPHTRL